jgi:glycosyltransferase involved in cell wall biosynthesis
MPYSPQVKRNVYHQSQLNENMEDMEVSVVLCTYDPSYDVFRESVDSILDQTYENYELVIIVDGTDEVYERAEAEYANHEDVIIHLNDENEGLAASRNTGARLANGDIVAFIDDDAVADPAWLAELVTTYEQQDVLAAGGKMIPEWVARKPEFLPSEFYWLIGVTHTGFANGPGDVRNTLGSNISFKRDVFLALDGFSTTIGLQGDKQLQAEEPEFCARLLREYGEHVYYNPDAQVAHKIFEYRTDPHWLFKRAFWQGYSKRAMETLLSDSLTEENAFLGYLACTSFPRRIKRLIAKRERTEAIQLGALVALTATVGIGYLYGMKEW